MNKEIENIDENKKSTDNNRFLKILEGNLYIFTISPYLLITNFFKGDSETMYAMTIGVILTIAILSITKKLIYNPTYFSRFVSRLLIVISIISCISTFTDSELLMLNIYLALPIIIPSLCLFLVVERILIYYVGIDKTKKVGVFTIKFLGGLYLIHFLYGLILYMIY